MNNFPNWADHTVVFLLCILLPITEIKQRLKESPVIIYTSKQKKSFYFSASLTLFIMAAITMLVWLLFRRPLVPLGFTIELKSDSWIWPAIAFVVLYIADTIHSVATPGNLASAKYEWEKRTPFLPTRSKELPGYVFMSLCAGVFEEIVYRGYLVTYFAYLFAGSTYQQALSIFVPAFVFSISHFYQGIKNVIKIFVLSSLFGYIFILSGSLMIVMLLHFLVNVVGGVLTMKYAASPTPPTACDKAQRRRKEGL